LISIKRFHRLSGKGSSDPASAASKVKEDDFGPQSLFSREPTDFDLITQLTHMSAVATSGIARDKLFEGTAELDYSTSKYFRRVHRVAQRLNYDYSQACEIVGEQAKEDSVQNLLLHFSTALSAGEPEADFLKRETEVQLELYGKKYERDMESLRKWTDAYIALMVSTTLIVVISLVSMMIYPVGTIAIAGLALVVMMVTAAGGWIIYTVAPHEVKTHKLARRSAEQAQMEKLAVVLISITGPVFVLGWIFLSLGVAMIVSALLLTPISWLAWQDDKKIGARDNDLPGFLRGLGSVMGAVGTTVAEGLSRLNRRSLGAMESHVRKLYVRLTNDLPPEMTWARLAGESGSELVTRCVRIFSDGIKVGGDPAQVGELASSFGQKVALLRASRSLVSNSFSFVVVPMHAALLGIILFVTEVVLIFGGKIAEVQEQNLDSDLLSEAGVSNAIVFAAPDAGFIRLLVVISILMLTAANSFAPYAASGGHRYKIFNYAVIMMLVSGISFLVIPEIVQGLFASVAEAPTTGGVPVQ
jgi:archaeal flagellar protein FlaJ